MPSDKLRLRNLRFYGYHGLLPEENRLGQRFEVDVEVCTDLSPAGRTDDLSQTIDYPRLISLVKEVVTGPPCRLLEALAEGIATRIGVAFAPVEVTVRVRKPAPPVPGDFDGVEVEIHRSYG